MPRRFLISIDIFRSAAIVSLLGLEVLVLSVFAVNVDERWMLSGLKTLVKVVVVLG